jgi:hypothetical protein
MLITAISLLAVLWPVLFLAEDSWKHRRHLRKVGKEIRIIPEPTKHELCLMEIERLEELNRKLERDYFKICNAEYFQSVEYGTAGKQTVAEIDRKGKQFLAEIKRKRSFEDRLEDCHTQQEVLELLISETQSKIASAFAVAGLLTDGTRLEFRKD